MSKLFIGMLEKLNKLNKDNMKTQCYIKIIKISISFSIDIQSSSVLQISYYIKPKTFFENYYYACTAFKTIE